VQPRQLSTVHRGPFRAAHGTFRAARVEVSCTSSADDACTTFSRVCSLRKWCAAWNRRCATRNEAVEDQPEFHHNRVAGPLVPAAPSEPNSASLGGPVGHAPTPAGSELGTGAGRRGPQPGQCVAGDLAQPAPGDQEGLGDHLLGGICTDVAAGRKPTLCRCTPRRSRRSARPRRCPVVASHPVLSGHLGLLTR
jgi:hypothetical protein